MRVKIDLTVAAIPAFVGAMVAERAWQRAHPVEPGTRAGDYQLADTVASLSMGIGSLAAPYVARRLLDPVTPGVGRHGRTLLALGAAAAVLTTVGDVVRRRVRDGSLPEPQTVPAAVREVQDELADIRQGPALARQDRPAVAPALRRTHGALAVSAVASTALVTSTTWAAMTAGKRLFARSPLDLGAGPWAAAAAVLGWDFIYYWNHRASHESRWLWAVHVVHHSSERYNLSTALRQPVAEGVTLTVPYGLLALAGVRPALIEQARGINLIYQFWIHTEAIQRLGWVEKVFNTPSHHRVHHGSNRDYLDRNHGSILILLGPALRDVRGGGRARRLRPDEQRRLLQPGADRDPRVGRHRRRRRGGGGLARPVLVPAAAPGMGVRPASRRRRRLTVADLGWAA